MNKHFNLKASLIVAAMLVLPIAQAATMSLADYKAGKTRISADYKTEKSACAALAGNTKDICVEEAKAKQKVAKAELEFGYTGKPSDQNKLLEARARSAYAVAKEKCDDQAGNAKAVCVKEARAIESKALVNARMGKEISQTRIEGAQDKLDADYKVAVQKCDVLSGDAKTNCLATAKAQFGKP